MQQSLFPELYKPPEKDSGFVRGISSTKEIFIDNKKIKTEDINWGYSGNERMNLSKVILLSLFNERITEEYHEQFDKEILEQLPIGDFILNIDSIKNWLTNKHGKTNS